MRAAPARTYDAHVSTTTQSPKPPAPECPTNQVGPCAVCGYPTHRYGHGGNPLCVLCLANVEAARAKK